MTVWSSRIHFLRVLGLAFSLPTLGVFFLAYFLLATFTYGVGIPSGLFVPALLSGAAYGRFVGM